MFANDTSESIAWADGGRRSSAVTVVDDGRLRPKALGLELDAALARGRTAPEGPLAAPPPFR